MIEMMIAGGKVPDKFSYNPKAFTDKQLQTLRTYYSGLKAKLEAESDNLIKVHVAISKSSEAVYIQVKQRGTHRIWTLSVRQHPSHVKMPNLKVWKLHRFNSLNEIGQAILAWIKGREDKAKTMIA